MTFCYTILWENITVVSEIQWALSKNRVLVFTEIYTSQGSRPYILFKRHGPHFLYFSSILAILLPTLSLTLTPTHPEACKEDRVHLETTDSKRLLYFLSIIIFFPSLWVFSHITGDKNVKGQFQISLVAPAILSMIIFSKSNQACQALFQLYQNKTTLINAWWHSKLKFPWKGMWRISPQGEIQTLCTCCFVYWVYLFFFLFFLYKGTVWPLPSRVFHHWWSFRSFLFLVGVMQCRWTTFIPALLFSTELSKNKKKRIGCCGTICKNYVGFLQTATNELPKKAERGNLEWI